MQKRERKRNGIFRTWMLYWLAGQQDWRMQSKSSNYLRLFSLGCGRTMNYCLAVLRTVIKQSIRYGPTINIWNLCLCFTLISLTDRKWCSNIHRVFELLWESFTCLINCSSTSEKNAITILRCPQQIVCDISRHNKCGKSNYCGNSLCLLFQP